MMHEKRQEPSLRKLIAGTLLGIWVAMLYAYGWNATLGIELPQRILLFVPERLGLIREAGPENTIFLDTSGEYIIRNLPAGEYWMQIRGDSPNQIIRIHELDTGRKIFQSNPFSHPYLRRMFFAGDYSVTFKTYDGSISIWPDYTDANNRVIVVTLFLEVLVILAIFTKDVANVAILWRGKERDRKEKLAADHGNRWAEFDRWLEEEKQKWRL